MTPARRAALLITAAAVACAPSPPAHRSPSPAAATASADELLSFSITDGRTENRFYRRGRVAAHLSVSSGESPKIVVAFPSGNMGVGMWFDEPTDLVMDGPVAGVERPGRARGVSANVRARVPRLRIRSIVLGSVRLLRAFGRNPLPVAIRNEIEPGPPVVVRRTTLDGDHHIEVRLEPMAGTRASVDASSRIVLTAAPTGDVAFKMTALADDEALTPVELKDLVTQDAADDAGALQALAFLSYHDKLLAGSWRFLTYFGRDTLLSTRLLMPVLQPPVIEASLRSVIERLSPDGEVAHEEDIGEFAVQRNLERTPRPRDLKTPLYDYKMVDDDFLLAPVLARYLLDTEAGRLRAPAFLGRRSTSGLTFAEAARKNLDRVLAQAVPFADRPSASTMIALVPGSPVGNWRDSNDGLGNGRVPYDVNAALVPAALRAAERLYASPLFGADRASAERAGALARAWTKAERLFRIDVPADEARRRVHAYATEQGIDPREPEASIAGTVSFPAVSLDARGTPVPVMHSDDGFVLLFGDPSPEWLVESAGRITRPFPAGLRTPVGVVVANPAFAPDPALRAVFHRGSYHGTVVWSWQQAMLAAGFARQLERKDLAPHVRKALADAEAALWKVIEDTRSARTRELWSFSVDAGGYHRVPFGQGSGHATESNAAQLWSTVYLAVKPPKGPR